jgi:membrane protein DedA with SNARE-associated domain
MPELASLVESYGYLAVFVGAFLEGETVLALGGLAAFRGYLDFYTVVVVAMIAGFLGDQVYFFLGRYRGQRLLARFPNAHERAQRFDTMLARWHAPLIICIRFMYGFRIMGAVLLGMGRVPSWKYMICNLIGAAIWAPLIAGIGYFFGSILESVLRDVKRYEVWVFVGVAAVGLALALAHRRREQKLEGEKPE